MKIYLLSPFIFLLAIFHLCLIFSSCQLSVEEGLVEYLEQNWDIDSIEMKLANPTAWIETAVDGEYEEVVTGSVYDSRTSGEGDRVLYAFKIEAPASTANGNVSGITDVSLDYQIWWCDTTLENPVFVLKEDEDDPWYGVASGNVEKSLETGIYYVKVSASADGFVDSDTVSWTFGVGNVADLVLSVSVEIENTPVEISVLPCFFTTTSFSGSHSFELLIESKNGSALADIEGLELVVRDGDTDSPGLTCVESSRSETSASYTCTLPDELEYAPDEYFLRVSFTCGQKPVLEYLKIYVFGTN